MPCNFQPLLWLKAITDMNSDATWMSFIFVYNTISFMILIDDKDCCVALSMIICYLFRCNLLLIILTINWWWRWVLMQYSPHGTYWKWCKYWNKSFGLLDSRISTQAWCNILIKFGNGTCLNATHSGKYSL